MLVNKEIDETAFEILDEDEYEDDLDEIILFDDIWDDEWMLESSCKIIQKEPQIGFFNSLEDFTDIFVNEYLSSEDNNIDIEIMSEDVMPILSNLIERHIFVPQVIDYCHTSLDDYIGLYSLSLIHYNDENHLYLERVEVDNKNLKIGYDNKYLPVGDAEMTQTMYISCKSPRDFVDKQISSGFNIVIFKIED